MTEPAVRTYLSWYRRGLASGLTSTAVRAAGRVQVPLTVTMSGRAESAQVPLQLYGPGDVIGLDARAISRAHPFPGCTTLEPGLFPHVELSEADLPWRFTPLAPDDQGRLQPWIALVVVDEAAATPSAPATGGLPLLSVALDQLPELTDAWAWAHVQVTRTAGRSIDDVLADTPERAVARLLCPRQLKPGHAYVACVVPTFEAGRLAGLGRDPAGAAEPLAAAWGAAETVELPVYFHWRFSTASPGSFETLVRSLTPRELAEDAGAVSVDLHDPGWGLRRVPPQDPRASVEVQGLLRAAGRTDPPPPVDADLISGLQAAVDQTGDRPHVRPPLYGQDSVDRRALPDPGEGPVWFREVNLDPRHRLAAGLGAQAVRLLQEDLVAEAWNQLAHEHGEVAAAQREQLADELRAAVGARHIAGLADEQLMALASPGTIAPGPERELVAGLTATLERLTRPSGPMARRARVLGEPGAEPGPGTSGDPVAALRLRRALSGQDPERTNAEDAGALSATTAVRAGFSPRFTRTGYELLRAVAPDWVLPGLGQVPPETVCLVETNAAFLEAFMLGLNHELGRELNWRRFPIDRSGTYFATFWPGTSARPPPTMRDVREWDPEAALGDNSGQQSDALVLLLRGELLRRHPGVRVYALRRQAGTEPPQVIEPAFGGRWGDDVAFVGFPFTAVEAFASDVAFVIEEPAQRARFGCDEASSAAPAIPATWQDLQWGNADFASRTHLPAAEGPMNGTTLEVARGSQEQATWGRDAAHMAVITQQLPLRAVLPAHLWNPTPVP